MRVKLVIITTVCIEEGRSRSYRVGSIMHTVNEFTEGKSQPKAIYTERRDDFFGKWKEVLRTEVEIDAPELDPNDLKKWTVKSLKARRKELEAEFYASTKQIDDEIASLLAIESK